MTPLNFLYFTLSMAVWIFVLLGILLGVALFLLIKEVRNFIKSAAKVTLTARLIENGLKVGAFGFLQNILNMFTGGGGKNGKR